MRIWLHSTAKSSSLGGSTAISMVAHAVLVGVAVYGTGVSARQLQQVIAERVSYLHYLPPPDRRPSSSNVVEHLQYVDVGTQGAALAERADGRVVAAVGAAKSKQSGGEQGDEIRAAAPSEAYESPDSVYSMLDVEETAARTAGSAAPVYPPDLMKAGTQGGVFIRFVVDSSGRADASSIEVIRSTNPQFTQSVRQAVPLMMFTPATVGGRHVRQLVEQNFEFKLTRPAPAEHTRVQPVP
ncbi:MAG: energy transducer TonB [bacterium]